MGFWKWLLYEFIEALMFICYILFYLGGMWMILIVLALITFEPLLNLEIALMLGIIWAIHFTYFGVWLNSEDHREEELKKEEKEKDV